MSVVCHGAGIFRPPPVWLDNSTRDDAHRFWVFPHTKRQKSTRVLRHVSSKAVKFHLLCYLIFFPLSFVCFNTQKSKQEVKMSSSLEIGGERRRGKKTEQFIFIWGFLLLPCFKKRKEKYKLVGSRDLVGADPVEISSGLICLLLLFIFKRTLRYFSSLVHEFLLIFLNKEFLWERNLKRSSHTSNLIPPLEDLKDAH